MQKGLLDKLGIYVLRDMIGNCIIKQITALPKEEVRIRFVEEYEITQVLTSYIENNGYLWYYKYKLKEWFLHCMKLVRLLDKY